MFDFRYHAVSLAAVFLALVVGLLLGVAIGDANLVSDAQHSLAKSLQSKVDAAAGVESQLRGQIAARRQYEAAVYPALVANRLKNKRIGLLFLGNTSDDIAQAVRNSIDPSGGSVPLVAPVSEPPDLNAVASQATGFGVIATDPSLLRRYGFLLGRQIVHGHGRLLNEVQATALPGYNGTLGKLDGVVLVRSDGNNEPATQNKIDTFDAGLAAGLASTNVPVVGVETSDTTPSTVPWFTQQSLSSVDDLDDIAGQSALVFSLAGARGAYGTKGTAQALVPQVASATAAQP